MPPGTPRPGNMHGELMSPGNTTEVPLRQLPRVLGPTAATAVVIGSVIGSGIFLKPSVIAQDVAQFSLIMAVWLVVGLITLCGALSVAEVAAMMPHAGGPFVYLREAFGRPVAFLWGWSEFWLMRTASVGALAVGTTIYLTRVIPLAESAAPLVAIGIVASVTLLNFCGARWGSLMQNVTTCIKLSALIALACLPFLLGKTAAENLEPVFVASQAKISWSGIGLALVAVLWPYDGWINMAPVAEEIRDPQKNIPRAFGIGVIVVMLAYLAANLAYHATLGHEGVRTSSAVAADVSGKLFGQTGITIITLAVMCSMFGALNANLLTGPRIYFAMARDGLLPPALHRIHARHQTPSNAILLQGGWAICLIAGAFAWVVWRANHPATDVAPAGVSNRMQGADAVFGYLTNLVVFGGNIFYALTVASVYVLRKKLPDHPRPYRTWGYPVVPLLYLVFFSVVLLFMATQLPWESAIGGALILSGLVYYYCFRRDPTGRTR